MMSVSHLSSTVSVAPAPVRLRLKPRGPVSGYVDGGWWPRSRDVAREVPALLAVLAVRLGPVQRVAFALDAWGAAPSRIEVGGRAIQLAGFASQDRDVLLVTGTNRRSVSLLVISPGASDPAGHDAMERAARPGNTESPMELLVESGVGPAAPVAGPRRPHNASAHRMGPR